MCCFITHSMGGLLAKQLLIESKLRGDRQDIYNQTKLVVFYSTPHKGSMLADYTKLLERVLKTTVALEDLALHAKHLMSLDRLFNFLNVNTLNFGLYCMPLTYSRRDQENFWNTGSSDSYSDFDIDC